LVYGGKSGGHRKGIQSDILKRQEMGSYGDAVRVQPSQLIETESNGFGRGREEKTARSAIKGHKRAVFRHPSAFHPLAWNANPFTFGVFILLPGGLLSGGVSRIWIGVTVSGRGIYVDWRRGIDDRRCGVDVDWAWGVVVGTAEGTPQKEASKKCPC
jgi:hypothetical protein